MKTAVVFDQNGVPSEKNKQEMAARKNGDLKELEEDNECDVEVIELFKEG